ncbi:MAG: tetratricopeptide repeat protein [Myxococcota bacterium]|nr:tetratricopeptide repeat protein [Myxococcota bacterium]
MDLRCEQCGALNQLADSASGDRGARLRCLACGAALRRRRRHFITPTYSPQPPTARYLSGLQAVVQAPPSSSPTTEEDLRRMDAALDAPPPPQPAPPPPGSAPRRLSSPGMPAVPGSRSGPQPRVDLARSSPLASSALRRARALARAELARPERRLSRLNQCVGAEPPLPSSSRTAPAPGTPPPALEAASTPPPAEVTPAPQGPAPLPAAEAVAPSEPAPDQGSAACAPGASCGPDVDPGPGSARGLEPQQPGPDPDEQTAAPAAPPSPWDEPLDDPGEAGPATRSGPTTDGLVSSCAPPRLSRPARLQAERPPPVPVGQESVPLAPLPATAQPLLGPQMAPQGQPVARLRPKRMAVFFATGAAVALLLVHLLRLRSADEAGARRAERLLHQAYALVERGDLTRFQEAHDLLLRAAGADESDPRPLGALAELHRAWAERLGAQLPEAQHHKELARHYAIQALSTGRKLPEELMRRLRLLAQPPAAPPTAPRATLPPEPAPAEKPPAPEPPRPPPPRARGGRDPLALARRALEGRRVREAQRLYTQLLQERGDDPEIHVGLAACALRTERFQAAAEHYQHALSLRPGHPAAILGMAETFRRRGDLERAAQWYRTYLLNPTAGSEARLARIQIDALERLLQKAPP